MSKKRILSLLLVVAMMLSFAIPAFAANETPVITAAYNKNAKIVTVTVDGVSKSFSGITNNTTGTYTVNGWEVTVAAKNDVATVVSKKQVAPPAVPPPAEVPVGGSSTSSNKQNDADTWKAGFGFHCNAANGNGRTDVTINGKVYKSSDQNDNGKDPAMHSGLVRVGSTTLWNLVKDDIVCATCGSTEWVTYSNKNGVINGKNIQAHHRAYAEVVKAWEDENPDDLIAVFDVYQYDSKKADGRGVFVIEGAVEGVKYQLEPGTYVVAERAKEGYLPQDDQRIIAQEGKIAFVYFTNVPDDGGEDGSFSFEKRVEGENIVDWLMAKFNNDVEKVFAILEGLEFTLSNDDNTYGPEAPDAFGKVVFNDVAFGTYTLSEEITGAAVGVFKAMDDIVDIVIDQNGVSITVDGAVHYGFDSVDFDTTAVYDASNRGGAWFKIDPSQSNGITDGGNVFEIRLTSRTDGEVYKSFCADPNSHGLAGDGGSGQDCQDGYIVSATYMLGDGYDDLIGILNFVDGKYGSVDSWSMTNSFDYAVENSTRLISQIAIWNQYVGVSVDDLLVSGVLLPTAYFGQAVLEALANTDATGQITGFAILVCANDIDGDHSETCQPQIVPITGGGFWVENEPEEGGEDGSFSFEKRVDGKNIVDWLMAKYENDVETVFAILEGLEFTLSNDDNTYGPETPNTFGRVVFNNVAFGTYTLSEEVAGAAVGVFKAMDDITDIVIDKNAVSVMISGTAHYGFGGSGLNSDFDKDATYNSDSTISPSATNTFVTNAFISGGVVQTNQWVANYKVEAVDGPTEGTSYLSFCAYSASTELGGDGSEKYLYVDKTDEFISEKGQDVYDDLILAYDYIVETWGNIDTWLAFAGGQPWGEEYAGQFYTDEWEVPTKYIAQIVTWNLLGDGLPYGELKAVGPNGYNTDIFDYINGCVDQVLAAVEEGKHANQDHVNDIVFLACDMYPGINLKCQPQIVPIGGGGFWVENDPDEGEEDSSLEFEKKVEGENIVDWLMAKFNNDVDKVFAVLEGLEFTLSNDDNTYGPESPNSFGKVTFPSVVPGTYTLSEEITGAAVGVFKAMADIEITLADGDNKIIAIGGTVKGNVDGVDIQPDDLFTIYNGYGKNGYDSAVDGLNYPGLTSNGDLFFISVTNTRTEDELASFCAYPGSATFAEGHGKYMVAQSVEDVSFLQAFNFIVDNYYGDDFGTFEDSGVARQSFARRVAQVVVWDLLGAINVDSEAYANSNLSDEEKAAVAATLAAVADGYVGGSVIDVLYMQCEEHGVGEYGLRNCQPQIVPIFGTFYVENEPEEGGEDGGVKFNKLVYGGSISEYFAATGAILQFSFDLFEILEDGESYVGTFDTDDFGAVVIETLKPGNYVFKEVAGSGGFFLNEHEDEEIAGSWGLTWHAQYPCEGCEGCPGGDGLYFTMPANGDDAVWPDCYELDAEGAPSVNNVFYCKHHVFWSRHEYQGAFIEQIPIDDGAGGYINIMDPETFAGYCGSYAQFDVFPATCTKPTRFSLACGCGATATGGSFGEPLGHDIDWDAPYALTLRDGHAIAGEVLYACSRGLEGCSEPYSPEAQPIVVDVELWEELTGLCAVCWLATDGQNYYCSCNEPVAWATATVAIFNDLVPLGEEPEVTPDPVSDVIVGEEDGEDEDEGDEVVVVVEDEDGEEDDEVAED